MERQLVNVYKVFLYELTGVAEKRGRGTAVKRVGGATMLSSTLDVWISTLCPDDNSKES